MEIQRKIYNRIVDWKNSTQGTKALLIEGARRIGKSTVAEEFGKNEYKSSSALFLLLNNHFCHNLQVFFQTHAFRRCGVEGHHFCIVRNSECDRDHV